MKHCVNPECPYRKSHRHAAEYDDHVALCIDCSMMLVEGEEPPASADASTVRHAPPWRRLAVSLLAPLALIVLGEQIPLPGVSMAALRRLQERAPDFFVGGDAGPVSILALGFMPALTAFIVVEAAAVLVPRWRKLRTSGPDGRRPLWLATWFVTAALATFQGWGVATALHGAGLLGSELSARALCTLTLVAGTMLIVHAARALDRFGLISGFSALIGISVVMKAALEVVRRATMVVREQADVVPLIVGPLLGSALLIAFVVWAMRSSARRAGHTLPIPSCGTAPIETASWLVAVPAMLAGLNLAISPRLFLLPTRSGNFFVQVALTCGFAGLYAWLFNRPRSIATIVSRVHGRRVEVDRQAWLYTAVRSAGVVAGLLLIAHMLDIVGAGRLLESTVNLAILAAVAMDLLGEWRARREHGELLPVWPIHRVYAVNPALDALRRTGIAAFARGMNHRTLGQFFAPFVPIDIMVSPERATEAVTVLRRILLGGKRPPKTPYRG